MRENIVKLDKAIKDMSVEEVREKLGDLKKSELMRSIILNEKEFCSCQYGRSQRNFWYSVVKPTLDKLGKLTAEDETEEGLTGWDKVLSKYLTELVKEGQLTYQDIKICDESRNYNVPESYTFSPYRNIVVCCEKDTIYQIVFDISALLGCSCISSKGICGFGAMETLLRKIRDYSVEPVKELIFLIMSDYDPTGYTIANTFEEQAKSMSKQLGMDVQIISKRIGITPDQLSAEEVQKNMYTPKKKGMKEWMEKTGGINGMEKGLELDALTPVEIRSIFADELQSYIDDGAYLEDSKESFLMGKIRHEVDKYVDVIVQEVFDELKDEIQGEEPNMMELVREGKKYIPFSNTYSINVDIEECVKKYFVS